MSASQLDAATQVDEEHWAVTLGSEDVHAVLFIEGVEKGAYFVKKLHLTGFGSSARSYYGVGIASGITPSMTSVAGVKVVDLTKKELRFNENRTRTWTLPRATAENMIAKAQLQEIEQPPLFSLYGRHAFFNIVDQMMGYPPADNCASWAINLLLEHGIKIKTAGNGFNIVTHTHSHTHRDVEESAYTINDLCQFAKEGNIEAIRRNFPRNYNVNRLAQFACAGPVESYLGLYTPLALAAAYGKTEVVNLLLTEYNADANLLVGRGNDLTVLDCAVKEFWLVTKDKPANLAIKNHLINNKTYNGEQLKVIAQNLCKAAYTGDNQEISRILDNLDPKISVNQLSSNSILAFWAAYLGSYSPLMAAVIANKIDTVKLLVDQFGADVNQLNGRGLDHTALDRALYYGHDEIVSYLREKNAKLGQELTTQSSLIRPESCKSL